MKLKDLKFYVDEESIRCHLRNPWTFGIIAEATDSEGNSFLRIIGRNTIYQKTDEGYQCTTCGSKIHGVRVIHPICGDSAGFWDGKTFCESVPYCPKCEEEPSIYGTMVILRQQITG